MTIDHLDTGPSSIRDDSICESSLPPNKSSGDIVERTVFDPFLNKDVQVSDRLVDRLRGRYACGPTMPNGEPEFGWREFQTSPIQHEAAAEIERLRRERDEARQLVTEANNSLFGSQAYFHSMNGGPFDRYHLSRGIEQIKDDARRHWQESQAAESAVAAAWEEAEDAVRKCASLDENGYICEKSVAITRIRAASERSRSSKAKAGDGND